MRRTREQGERVRARRGRLPARVMACCVLPCACWLAGCSMHHHQVAPKNTTGDPLVGDFNPPPASSPPPGNWAPPGAGISPAAGIAPAGGRWIYEQLKAQLSARGVNWWRGESAPTGFKFVCTIPNRFNPRMNRIYEASAAD